MTTPNTIHMVLGRIDGAAPGVKGISLFIVPKCLVNPDGSLGARNERALPVHRAQARHPRESDLRLAFGEKAARLPIRR